MSDTAAQTAELQKAVLLVRANFKEGTGRVDMFKQIAVVEQKPVLEKVALNDPTINVPGNEADIMLTVIQRQVTRGLAELREQQVTISVVASGVDKADEAKVSAAIKETLAAAAGKRDEIKRSGVKDTVGFAARLGGNDRRQVGVRSILERQLQETDATSRISSNIEFKSTVGEVDILKLDREGVQNLAGSRITGAGLIGVAS